MTTEEQQRIEANIAACKAALADPSKQLQARIRMDGRWREWSNPFHPDLEYRIKPEPAVIYCNEYPGSEWSAGYTTPDEARRGASHHAIRTAVRFVEAPEGGGE